MIARAEDGTVIHIFEWESSKAVAKAERDEDVQANWARFAKLSDFVAIGDLAEARHPFSGFTAIEP